jgi:hypothetical protein
VLGNPSIFGIFENFDIKTFATYHTSQTHETISWKSGLAGDPNHSGAQRKK